MEVTTDIVNRDDVLTKINISKRTLQYWEKRGLPRYTVGRKVFYRMREVEAFITGEGQNTATKKYGLR